MNPHIDIDFDAEWFEIGVASALRELGSLTDRQGDAGTIDRLSELLRAWRGDFLESEDVGDWHVAIRDRLAHLYVEGMSAVADARLHGAELEPARVAYEAVIAADELREDAWRGLMTTLARLGDRNGALRAYARLSSMLDEQLDALPEPETAEIFDRLRKGPGV